MGSTTWARKRKRTARIRSSFYKNKKGVYKQPKWTRGQSRKKFLYANRKKLKGKYTPATLGRKATFRPNLQTSFSRIGPYKALSAPQAIAGQPGTAAITTTGNLNTAYGAQINQVHVFGEASFWNDTSNTSKHTFNSIFRCSQVMEPIFIDDERAMQKIWLKQIQAKLTICNASNTQSTVVIRDIRMIRHDNKGDSPYDVWKQGDGESNFVVDDFNFLTDPQDPGANPEQCARFRKYFKVCKTTKLEMQPGATHLHTLHMNYGKPVEFSDVFESEPDVSKGYMMEYTRFIMVTLLGQNTAVTTEGEVGYGKAYITWNLEERVHWTRYMPRARNLFQARSDYQGGHDMQVFDPTSGHVEVITNAQVPADHDITYVHNV